MILRRLAEAIREQNWFTVMLEILIVVIGIFTGMQVDDWNDARKNRVEERGYLIALRADFEESISRLAKHVEDRTHQSEALERLAAYSDDPDAKMDRDELDLLVRHGLYDLLTFLPRHATLEEMNSSGKLGLIADADLRISLQQVSTLFDDLKVSESDYTQMFYLFSDPYLVRNYDVRGFISREAVVPGRQPLRWLTADQNRVDSTAALKSREFQNILLYRGDLNAGTLANAAELNAGYTEVIQRIDARLAELGAE